ncbi:MAG: hypothetical protein IJO68_01125 [Clostridia bacterium]|nr:hypothetical protein [Clostridia bacterium]
MADTDKNKNNDIGTEESVDDILAGILNPDGTFNDEFNGLFARYVGGGQPAAVVPDADLSDRTDEEPPKERLAYDSGELSRNAEKTADERIAGKMSPEVRDIYEEASSDAQRPEFTASGDVRYPTMGVGEAEQRVVFDADWEERAKKEAARRERVRQDRMLRGDSTYARTFVAGGMYMPQRNPYVDAPGANPLYIDPLSGDEDFETADETSAYYNSHKKPFFPEGFSAAPKSSSAAGGKTTNSGSGRGYSSRDKGSRMADGASADWLRVEDKADKKKKKRGLSRRKKVKDISDNKSDDSAAEFTPDSASLVPSAGEVPQRPRVSPFAGEDINDVADETKGLRSTVAEIVDKYNKRSEEEARRQQEEKERLEELRREQELRERRRQEELRLLKKEMSPELCEAIDSEEDSPSFDEYDDFSTDPSENNDKKTEKKPEKIFGVVFDPAAFDSESYVERLEDGDGTDEEEVRENAVTVKNDKKKKRSKK